MKTTHILIGLMAAGSMMMAGEVNGLKTFVSGTEAKALEVNGNFATVKTAVDGNAGDITTNVSGIAANRTNIATHEANITTNANGVATNVTNITTLAGRVTTNETDISNKVSSVTAAGGLSSSLLNNDVTIKRASGYVSVHSSAFSTSNDINDQTQTCVPSYYDGFVFLFLKSSTKNSCKAFAPVSLPDGATITALQCFMVKNDGQTATPSEVDLRNLNAGGISSQMAKVEIPALHNNGRIVASTEDTTIQNSTVDNNQYTYFLQYNPPDNTNDAGGAGMKNRIATCKIGYEF
jgi:hypothetical protein